MVNVEYSSIGYQKQRRVIAVNNKDFIKYCKDISRKIASDLRYGEFVDAYIVLEEKIYNNTILWNEITAYPGRNHILKEELAKAFSSCIYTKDAKEIIKALRNDDESIYNDNIREFMEKELEKYIQKDVLNMSSVGKKRLKIALLREAAYYRYTNSVTEKQKANAPSITWQEGLDAIHNNIKGSRIRARNAQRLALNLPEVDIFKYQKLQEDEFINEYKKFHDDTSDLDFSINVLPTTTRKIEKYINEKEPFFTRLINIHKIRAVPVYILEKMGLLTLFKLRRDVAKARKNGATKDEIKTIRKEAIKQLGYTKENKQNNVDLSKKTIESEQKVKIREEHNEVVTYDKDEKVKNLVQVPRMEINKEHNNDMDIKR